MNFFLNKIKGLINWLLNQSYQKMPSLISLFLQWMDHLITLTEADYNDYLQYQTSRQQSSTACTIQPSSSFAYVAQSSSQEQWILDSGASDHISGDKNTLYSYYPFYSLYCYFGE